MEKESLYGGVPETPPQFELPQTPIHRCRPSRTRRERRTAILGIVSFSAVVYGLLAVRNHWHWDLYHRVTGASQCVGLCNPKNIWESISPSTELEWHDCYADLSPDGVPFQCARLTVPLDYNADQATTNLDGSENQVHLALVLRPAEDGSTSSSKPPMLINPGGPGGSGTMLALLVGQSMQTIFGSDQPILGFDPRGIGYTYPSADCWATPPTSPCIGSNNNSSKCQDEDDFNLGIQHRLEWIKQNGAYGFINSTDVSLKFLDAGQRAVNKLCSARDERHGGKSILRHASTAHVARDMLSIIDAWDRWISSESAGTGSTTGSTSTSRDTQKNEDEEKKSKLVYWGFSYGTYLGIKFASMFPGRVGRLMLDGVVDAEFYESPVWVESLLDTDKILDLFFEFCADAESKEKCALHREGDTPSSVEKRYNDVMNRLQYGEPIMFIHPVYFYPVVLQAELFRTLVFSMLYSPKAMFPILGVLLDNLFEERYEIFGGMFGDAVQLCSPGMYPVLGQILNDAQRAIMCSDKAALVNQPPEEIRAAFEKMAENSQFADIWMSLMMQCNGWDLFEKDPLAQPTTDHSAKSSGVEMDNISQINTSFPILFLSNTLDPVTPLKAAVKMARRFNGAGLLEQKSAGHCTISSASRCTAKVLKAYINEGKVPPPPVFSSNSNAGDGHGEGEEDSDEDLLNGKWMTCEADERIGRSLARVRGQEEDSWGEEEMAKMEEEDREVLSAMLKIQDVLRSIPMWDVQGRPGFLGVPM